MIDRSHREYNGDELISHTYRDVSWFELRQLRDLVLKECDWRFMSDQSPSDEWVNYRVFLRDLPQTYPGELANEACDAWMDYDKPEGA